jgi:hypothetical protein
MTDMGCLSSILRPFWRSFHIRPVWIWVVILFITTFLKKLPHQASMDMGCHLIYIYDLFEGVSTSDHGNLKLPKRGGGGRRQARSMEKRRQRGLSSLYRKPQALIHMRTGSSAFSLRSISWHNFCNLDMKYLAGPVLFTHVHLNFFR